MPYSLRNRERRWLCENAKLPSVIRRLGRGQSGARPRSDANVHVRKGKSLLTGNTLRPERWGRKFEAEVTRRAVGAQAGARSALPPS